MQKNNNTEFLNKQAIGIYFYIHIKCYWNDS